MSAEGSAGARTEAPEQAAGDRVSDPEELINKYRYTLVNVIEVDQALSWLLQNGVLDKDDQDAILNKYKQNHVLRAGHLIDTVMKRDSRGFNCLMEFIEYELPDIFEKMTQQTPRKPDSRVNIPTRNRPQSVTTQLMKGIEQLLVAHEQSSMARKRAETYIKELQERITAMENELEMKHTQILDLTQKVLDVEAHNKDLTEQLLQAQKERTEAVKQQQILREARDKYQGESQAQCQKMMAQLRRFIKSSTHSTSLPPAKQPFSREQVLPEQETSDTESDEMAKLRSIMKQLREENEELFNDKQCLEDQLDKIANKCDLFDSNITEYQDQVKCLQEERDQLSCEFEELKRKYYNLQQENASLKKKVIRQQSLLRIFKHDSSEGRSRLDNIMGQNDIKLTKEKLAELEQGFTSFSSED